MFLSLPSAKLQLQVLFLREGDQVNFLEAWSEGYQDPVERCSKQRMRNTYTTHVSMQCVYAMCLCHVFVYDVYDILCVYMYDHVWSCV